MSRQYKVLKKPLTNKQLQSRMDDGFSVEAVVSVDLDEMIGRSMEDFLDLLSMRLTGTEHLSDISYVVVGGKGKSIHISVLADVAEVIS